MDGAVALDKFKEASQLQPSGALFANDVGFASFKLGQHKEVVQWFQKAIADRTCAIANLNLGDAYLELRKKPEAEQAYELPGTAAQFEGRPGFQE